MVGGSFELKTSCKFASVFTANTSSKLGMPVLALLAKDTPVPPKLCLNPKVELKPLVSVLVEILTDFRSVLLENKS
jgi:hypothetical protein